MKGHWLSLPIAVLFFLSGFSALVYQISWQRLLGLFLGIDVFAASVVVGAFMIGLGTGSAAGGYIADRVKKSALIPIFAITEIIVAAFGLASKTLFYDFLPVLSRDLGYGPMSLVLPCLALILPTFCMGLTLPLLSRALIADTQSAGRKIGLLYGVNTLGAAAGAICSTVLFMRFFGITGALCIAAILNVATALGSMLVSLQSREEQHDLLSTRKIEESPRAFGIYPLIYCLSGLTALALELIWFRMLGVMLKSNSFTFSWLLFLYLTGLAAGTFLGLARVDRLPKPFLSFLGLQAFVTLYSGLSVSVLLNCTDSAPWLAPVKKYLSSYEPMDWSSLSSPDPTFFMLYVVVAGLLILPPTMAMGASFPLLQKAVHTDMESIGRRVGWLQFANIAGATIGTILVGIFTLGVLGTSASLKIVVAIGGTFVFLFWHIRSHGMRIPFRIGGYALGLAAVAFTFVSIPKHRVFWARLHGVAPHEIIVKESAAGVTSVTSMGGYFKGVNSVFVNGLGQAFLPFNVSAIHTQLGMLPIFLHPAPKDIGIIGLGSGTTVFSAGGRKEIRSIDCIEIISSQIDALKELEPRMSYRSLTNLLSDARIRFHFADGRRFIAEQGKKFDVLEADALRPQSAYSNNVYSREYFSLVKNHLKPGGLAITWSPNRRTYNSFTAVFPYCVEFGPILAGSNEPIEVDISKIRRRWSDPFSDRYYRDAEIDPEKTLGDLLAMARKASPDKNATTPNCFNDDLYPRQELGTPEDL